VRKRRRGIEPYCEVLGGIFAKEDFDGHAEIVARRRCEVSIELSPVAGG
jgi:hypothetical protein